MYHSGLVGLTSDPRNGVVARHSSVHFVMGREDFGNLKEALVRKLNLNVNKFYPDAGGVLMGYQRIKVKKSTSELAPTSLLHPVYFRAQFFLFQPKVGLDLFCVVNTREEGRVSCLVHGVFTVDVINPKCWETVFVGQTVMVKVEAVEQLACQEPKILVSLVEVTGEIEFVEELDAEESVKPLEKKFDEKYSNVKPCILFSGLGSSSCKKVSAIVISLNGVVTDTPRECSHLVMEKLKRTDKMLMCLPLVRYVLSLKWIIDSEVAGVWLSEEDYFLHDPEMEEKYGVDLKKTLAMNERDKLFTGKTFYLTTSVQSGHPALASIITHSGGRVESSRRSLGEMKILNSGETVDYIIITTEADVHIVADVLKAGQGVFSSEFVLSAVTRGEMDFDLSNYLEWG